MTLSFAKEGSKFGQKLNKPFKNFAKSGHTSLLLRRDSMAPFRQVRVRVLVRLGRSPGLVVKGGDLCSRGQEFESDGRTLDGKVFTFYLL